MEHAYDVHVKLTCKAVYDSIRQDTCSRHNITPAHFHACVRTCMSHWGEVPTQWDRWVDAAQSVQGDFDVLRGMFSTTCKGE